MAIDGATHPRCRTNTSLDGLTSFFHYDGIIKKAVKALKYRLVSNLASEFVSLISPIHFSPLGTLVPIPLHHSRRMERGFNQAEVLGKLIADRLRIPIRTDILRRIRKTIPQVEMKNRKARLKNMDHVFAVNTTESHIILFDDVFTTGATMRSAAHTLKRNGAEWIWVVTMAR